MPGLSQVMRMRDRRPATGRRRTIAQAIAEDRPAWYRIRVTYSRYQLHAWTERHTCCDVPDGITAQLLMNEHPEIDWWRSHDIDVVTGSVYAMPEPEETGFLPEVDRSFGARRPPHLVADRWGADCGRFDTVPPMPARWAA